MLKAKVISYPWGMFSLLIVTMTLTPIKADEDTHIELAKKLLAAPQYQRRETISKSREHLTAGFFERVRMQIKWYCLQGQADDALEFWELLRLVENEVGLKHQALVTACNFEGTVEIGISTYTIEDFGNVGWEDPSLGFAQGELDFNRGYLQRAQNAFERLRDSGYQPDACRLYLRLIEQELSRFGEL